MVNPPGVAGQYCAQNRLSYCSVKDNHWYKDQHIPKWVANFGTHPQACLEPPFSTCLHWTQSDQIGRVNSQVECPAVDRLGIRTHHPWRNVSMTRDTMTGSIMLSIFLFRFWHVLITRKPRVRGQTWNHSHLWTRHTAAFNVWSYSLTIPTDPEMLQPKSGGLSLGLPSGNLLHSYWKWSFTVDLPMINGDFL